MSTTALPTSALAAAPPGEMRSATRRVDAVDLLRGLVMVVMLLDHTRDFVHDAIFRFDPTDLRQTTVALFLTRWVTHFCAPSFVFLAGAGAALQKLRGKPVAELSRFLWTRGLWLVVLELTVVRWVIGFNVDYTAGVWLQVIWATGVGMIVLAALVRFPVAVSAAFGVGMIALHNLADGVTPAPGVVGGVWMVLHQPGFLAIPGLPVLVLYPLVPWIGVVAAGYAFGHVYGWEAERRRRFLLRTGAAVTVGFVLLRLANVYGDPSPWAVQPRGAAYTLLSFLNTSKYPPSLLFLAMTLGPAMLFLAWVERRGTGWLGRAMVTFGRVPLFFYVLQWIAVHVAGIGLMAAAGRPVGYLFLLPTQAAAAAPPSAGFPLWVVYCAWIAGTVALYPLCRWFAAVKARRRDWWLSYL
jgi:uncharacterized membrane protein